ncbi:MAG: exodeoxyribonuclease V subunit alpha [Acidobacteriota bacterium]
MSAFDAVAASTALAPIDVHFGRLIRRSARDVDGDSDVLALTAALLSRQRGRGHSCIDPRDWAGRPFPTEGVSTLPPLPELRAWQRALAASELVGDGSQPTPLVRDAAGRLYLRRYWRAEQRLAGHLTERLRRPRPELDPEALAPLFRSLFGRAGNASADEVDWQAVAAAVALGRGVALITGGPGTGKTTTVGRILALLTAVDEERRIALAAPTGKAAARLGEAIAEQLDGLPIDGDHRERIPRQASTLHRLLGFDPRRDRFRHRAGRPLAVDTLVIDEASMVDLLMMSAVFDALPSDAQVILLGDRDQLASVETGFVFGDLCAAANPDGSYSAQLVEHFRRLGGGELEVRPADSSPPAPLRDAAVELRVSYRFRDQPGIGRLAGTIRQRQADQALEVLDDPEFPDVVRHDPPSDPRSSLQPLHRALAHYLAADAPDQALERLAQFRILCARRQGDWGVERLNAVVERHLSSSGHPVEERWYPARPIIVTANDYQVRLFNGDLGVCWPVDGRLWAWFDTGSELRRLPLAKLPPHETAWAMTVHKSQGSEFDQVLLVLGDTDSQVMTRELLYTGITRARRDVTVVATPQLLRVAILRAVRRASGLVDALAPPDSPPAAEAPTSTGETSAPTQDEELDSESGQLSLF